MVSYKAIMSSAMARKPLRALSSTFTTFRHSAKASLPFKLKIECSSVCNLRCTMCPLHNGLKRKQGFLKFEKFKFIYDQVKPAYLNLTGIGETFLNKDLFKIVKYAKEKRAMVKLDSNGTLLDEETINNILKTGIDIISISIDGVDKESYEKIRVGAKFEEVKKNVKNLVRIRNERKSKSQIHMFFVLQEGNIKKLPDFIKLAEELGVDYIAGSFVVTLGDNENKRNKIFNYKETEEIVRKTRETIKNAKPEVSIEPLLEYLLKRGNKEFYNKEKPCYMAWYSTFITWDGYVNPCDFSCDNEVVFGNVFKEPFKKIWNNEKIKNFRRQILKNREGIKICRGCGVDETYIENEIKKIEKIPFSKLMQYNPK